MEIFIILAIGGAVALILLIKLAFHSYRQLKTEALARYEKIKAGNFCETDLNKHEQAILKKLRKEKTCSSFDGSQLLFWAFIMHNHNVLPQEIVQNYEVELQTSFPEVYQTYQQCYNSYCSYNSGGSYSGYTSYSSY